ncbi:MAG: beta-L-arabinofuranosidase domain-containing protein [Verrucomicrobiota bacterium]|jgi:DUF1680 family protein
MKKVALFCLFPALLAGAAYAQDTNVTTAATPPAAEAPAPPPDLYVDAGIDRDVVMPGKTYLQGYAGYNNPARRGGGGGRRNGGGGASARTGPAVTVAWSKASGPGTVTFAEEGKAETSAAFSQTGTYVLKMSGQNSATNLSSTLTVRVAEAPPKDRLDVVYTKNYVIDSPLWNDRAKSLIAGWIPHCIDQINRTNLTQVQGGIDNFIEAAKALRGEPYTPHKGYVFANAWVHQTVEAMCIALMIDPRGDPDIIKAQEKFHATLEDWIPKILAAQEPDGYLQTAFTARPPDSRWTEHWSPAFRGNHEGYTAGYFIESAINHYTMTGGKDTRLYDAAKKLADCWVAHIGPEPGKKVWFDGHQEMEQALVRFGRFVNDMEGHGRGDAYVKLAKFLLDSRQGGSEYDQSHLPMIKQYEAVGHAVRAAYTYSGMADVAAETHDTDYQSAVLSLWDNIVNKKYYVTGGIGSGETSEGFGPNYSLRNGAYCESCSTCGLIFFQYKMNLAYHDAKYADLYEESLYNALLGATDLEGQTFFYDNPLVDGRRTPWHACPCCVGNIPRTLLMLPTWTYVRGDDGLYVNLFIGSTINVEKVAGSDGQTEVQMVQKTDYPWSGHVAITVNPKESKTFTVYVRAPNRSTSALYTETPRVSGLVSLAVNGQKMTPQIDKGYAAIKRTWHAGDRIEVVLPMEVQRITADPKIAADRGLEALRYGPLLYNVERADNAAITNAIGTGPLKAVWRPDLLHGVMAIAGTWADGSPLLAIPNYARLNRLGQAGPAPAVGGDASINYAGNTSTNAPGATTQAAAVGGGSSGGRGGRGGPVRSEVWMKAEH